MIHGFQTAITYLYTSKIPLNDVNSFYADETHLLGFKLGYQKTLNRIGIKLFAGVDNLLNERYSLGNDINGFGGRFYNAAAERNYYAGLNFSFSKKKDL